jgi:hypothetical protein
VAEENRVELDDAEIEEAMSGDHGLVHDFLDALTKRMEEIAIPKAPVRAPGSVWNEETTSAAPIGWTKASIQRRIGRHRGSGGLYGSINAAGHAAIFLEKPRVNREKEPFLTTALWEVEIF